MKGRRHRRKLDTKVEEGREREREKDRKIEGRNRETDTTE